MLTREKILYYYDRPVEFTEDIIGVTPDSRQAAIMRDVAANSLTSVRSGHGIGKTALQSWLIDWYMFTRPYPKIPCTAPTKHQLHDILWAEVAKWIRHSPLLSNNLIWTQEKVFMKGHPEEWFAVPRTASKPDALQGFHAEHVLFIIDEASGVDDKIFEPVLGALTTPDAKLLLCGNPTKLSGFFYDSHHKNRSIYRVHHVDGRNSGRVSNEFVRSIIDMYGEDSDVFRVRVAGEFPKAMADSFIAMEWAERNSVTEQIVCAPRRVDIGVDVARFGDDDSVITAVFDRKMQNCIDRYHHNDTMQLTGHVVAKIKEYAHAYPVEEIHVKVDIGGLGAGVYDRLEEQRREILSDIQQRREELADREREQGNNDASAVPITLTFYDCNFGGEGGNINLDDPVEYANGTGLMWGTAREALRTDALTLLYDDRQIAELSNRRYRLDSNGKIILERKEDMKKRGLSSPDIADALALAMYEPAGQDWGLTW